MYFIDILPLFMFLALAVFMFSGYPVAFVLGGTSIAFGFIGHYFDVFSLIEFYNIVARTWGGVAEKPILVALPMFIFMGTMLEKSGVATDLLHCLQTLLRRAPGGLAISVTLTGTILAATTGIVGASVVMMTLLALPVMMQRGYQLELSTGTIAASSTLGILIPPSIMLVILADLLAVSVGTLFMAAIIPGLILSTLFVLYIVIVCKIRPGLAPKMSDDEAPADRREFALMLLRSFIPPVILIVLVLGSILFGWATPTEAAGVGAFGATLLAFLNGKLSRAVFKDVIENFSKSNVMIFMIFIGATAFSYVFRSLGGDDVISHLFEQADLSPALVIFMMLALVFLMGFFFDWIEIILIALPVFTPIIETLDLGTHVPHGDLVVWFAILIAVNLQTSYLTPPFGYALFYMKGVAPRGVTMQNIYRGVIPFVLLQLTGLALVVAFPALALWLPEIISR